MKIKNINVETKNVLSNNVEMLHCNISTKKPPAFTLVELIVVITILAILATIAFLSFQNISSTARDSSRLSDIRNVKSVLELAQIDSANYPLPDGATQIVWSGAVAWTQGTMGDTAIQTLKKFSKKPIDPLTNTAYTYSVTSSQKEYQIGYALENSLAATNPPVLADIPLNKGDLSGIFASFINTPYQGGKRGTSGGINKTFADTSSLLGYTDGNYNGLMIKVNTGSTDYYLGVPSIITSDTSKTNLVNQTGSLVFNGKKCLASSYSGIVANTSCSVFNPNTNGNFVIYSTGAGKSPDTTDFLTKLKNTYTGAVLNTISDTNLTNRINGVSTTNTLVSVLSKVGTAVNNVAIDNIPSITCPTGFILVPGNSTFNTSDFCVAKYEMTYSNLSSNPSNNTWNTYPYTSASNIVSQPGYPIASLNQTQAIEACRSMGAGYHLITNNEWMTIAKNIEGVGSNWSGGSPGNGGLYRGISEETTYGCDGNPDGERGVPSSSGTPTCTRRVHTLSNGNQIRDLVGNVWEHVDRSNNKDITTAQVGNGNLCNTSNYWYINGDPSTTCQAGYGPSLVYTKGGVDIGMGYVWNNTGTDKVFLRGGSAYDGADTGIFALHLSRTTTNAYQHVGFRCSL